MHKYPLDEEIAAKFLIKMRLKLMYYPITICKYSINKEVQFWEIKLCVSETSVTSVGIHPQCMFKVNNKDNRVMKINFFKANCKDTKMALILSFWCIYWKVYEFRALYECPFWLKVYSKQVQEVDRKFRVNKLNLLVQSEQWKQQDNEWNLFKVNKKNSRKTPLTSLCCLYCKLWTDSTH